MWYTNGVTQGALGYLVDQHRNPAFWDQPSPGQWTFRGPASPASSGGAEPAEGTAGPSAKCAFEANSDLGYGASARYVVIGKGYP